MANLPDFLAKSLEDLQHIIEAQRRTIEQKNEEIAHLTTRINSLMGHNRDLRYMQKGLEATINELQTQEHRNTTY